MELGHAKSGDHPGKSRAPVHEARYDRQPEQQEGDILTIGERGRERNGPAAGKGDRGAMSSSRPEEDCQHQRQ